MLGKNDLTDIMLFLGQLSTSDYLFLCSQLCKTKK